MSKVRNNALGFTVIELAVVVLISGVIIAIATPKITNAMREYRINIAMRQMVDTFNHAKAQAVADNVRSAMMIDTANSRYGMATLTYNAGTALWVVNTVNYVSLPQGVTFQRPTAAPTGVTSTGVTSFTVTSPSTLFRQDFTSRGFPVVAAGADVVSVFIGNGKSYRAITMTSVGGIRTYSTSNLVSAWADTRY